MMLGPVGHYWDLAFAPSDVGTTGGLGAEEGQGLT